MDLSEVLEVEILHDKDSINQHLKCGWKLLSIATGCVGDYRESTYIITEVTLGRVQDSKEIPLPQPKTCMYSQEV